MLVLDLHSGGVRHPAASVHRKYISAGALPSLNRYLISILNS